MTSAGPATKPPQAASDLLNVPTRRSTRSSTPSSSAVPAPRRPRTPAPWASSTMQARAEALGEVADLRQRREVALHREDAVDDDRGRRRRRRLARSSERSSLSIRLWRKARSLARDSRQPSRIDAWSPESATTVSPGPRIVPSAPRFAWWPVREDERVVGPHPLGDLALQLEVQRDRAVQQPRAGQAGPVLHQRVLRALDDALVGGQAEIVVGAEHDPLGALHLDDRAAPGPRACGSRAGRPPRAPRAAAPGDRACGPSRRRRCGSRACRVRRRGAGGTARSIGQGQTGLHRSPVPAACYLAPVDASAADRAPAVPQPALQRVLQAR